MKIRTLFAIAALVGLSALAGCADTPNGDPADVGEDVFDTEDDSDTGDDAETDDGSEDNAPEIVAVNPIEEDGVLTGVEVVWNVELDPDTVDDDTMYIEPSHGMTRVHSGATTVYESTTSLLPGTTYTLHVDGVADEDGNAANLVHPLVTTDDAGPQRLDNDGIAVPYDAELLYDEGGNAIALWSHSSESTTRSLRAETSYALYHAADDTWSEAERLTDDEDVLVASDGSSFMVRFRNEFLYITANASGWTKEAGVVTGGSLSPAFLLVNDAGYFALEERSDHVDIFNEGTWSTETFRTDGLQAREVAAVLQDDTLVVAFSSSDGTASGWSVYLTARLPGGWSSPLRLGDNATSDRPANIQFAPQPSGQGIGVVWEQDANNDFPDELWFAEAVIDAPLVSVTVDGQPVAGINERVSEVASSSASDHYVIVYQARRDLWAATSEDGVEWTVTPLMEDYGVGFEEIQVETFDSRVAVATKLWARGEDCAPFGYCLYGLEWEDDSWSAPALLTDGVDENSGFDLSYVDVSTGVVEPVIGWASGRQARVQRADIPNAPFFIYDEDSGARSATLAVDNGDWRFLFASGPEFVLAQSTGMDNIIYSVDRPGMRSSLVRAAISNTGMRSVGWVQTTGTSQELRVRMSEGGLWSNGTSSPSGPLPLNAISHWELASAGDDVSALWLTASTLSASTWSDGEWTDPTVLSDAAVSDPPPMVRASNDSIVVLWTEEENTELTTYSLKARSYVNGQWQSETLIGTFAPDTDREKIDIQHGGQHVELSAGPDGRLSLAYWAGGARQDQQLLVREYREGAWSDAVDTGLSASSTRPVALHSIENGVVLVAVDEDSLQYLEVIDGSATDAVELAANADHDELLVLVSGNARMVLRHDRNEYDYFVQIFDGDSWLPAEPLALESEFPELSALASSDGFNLLHQTEEGESGESLQLLVHDLIRLSEGQAFEGLASDFATATVGEVNVLAFGERVYNEAEDRHFYDLALYVNDSISWDTASVTRVPRDEEASIYDVSLLAAPGASAMPFWFETNDLDDNVLYGVLGVSTQP